MPPPNTSATGHMRARLGVGVGGQLTHVPEHREKPDGHDVHARVAAGVAIGTELAEVIRSLDPGLLAQLP